MDIIGMGRPCIDILTVINQLPKPDSGSGILDTSRQGGGNVATAMVAAARLGVKAGFIGASGTCVNGKFIREDFAYNNVDISRSVTVEGKTSAFAIILSDLETKGRSILYNGGNTRRIEMGDLDKDYIVVIGIEAHICVQQTILDVLDKEHHNVYLVADCVGSRNDIDKNFALKRLAEYGAVVTTLEAVLFELLHTAEHPRRKEVQALLVDL